MRKLLTIVWLLAPLTLLAQINDIYFVPTKKSAKEEVQNVATTIIEQQIVEENSSMSLRDEDEYNRRYSSSYTVAPEQESDDYEYADEEQVVTRSYSISDDEDYKYASRLVRFHSPGRVLLSSPWYWDVVYNSGYSNWTIYDDGTYWDIYTDDWFYRPSWSWSYYSPYYYAGCYNPWGYWNGFWNHHYHNHDYKDHT